MATNFPGQYSSAKPSQTERQFGRLPSPPRPKQYGVLPPEDPSSLESSFQPSVQYGALPDVYNPNPVTDTDRLMRGVMSQKYSRQRQAAGSEMPESAKNECFAGAFSAVTVFIIVLAIFGVITAGLMISGMFMKDKPILLTMSYSTLSLLLVGLLATAFFTINKSMSCKRRAKKLV